MTHFIKTDEPTMTVEEFYAKWGQLVYYFVDNS